MNDREDFAKLVRALSPWKHQLVFIGGWAHRLYRLHPMATSPAYPPVVTRDADVAFANRERMDGSIRARLQEAGFKEQLMGTHRPPVSQYTLGEDEQRGFYAEFLTPLIGPAFTKEGQQIATLAKADITAQRLRYLDLLLKSPWNVTLDADWGAEGPLDLRVPNPVAFIMQKFLIHEGRPANKQAQDILYVHDTLELFGSQLSELTALWRNDVRDSLNEGWKATITKTISALFGKANDRIRDAAAIPQDRGLDPERMRLMCRAALQEILE